MKRNQMLVASASLCRRIGLFALPFLMLMVSHTQSAAQIMKVVTLKKDTPIRVKISSKVTSARVMIGDYVQFQVVDNVVVRFAGEDQVVIPKDTVAFGRVVEHKNRRWVFKAGQVGVTLEKIFAVDGSQVFVDIARPQFTLAKKELDEGKLTSPQERELKNAVTASELKPCKNRIRNDLVDPANPNDVSCIKGRVYLSNITASLPSAVLGTIAAAALVLVNDNTARAAASITLASQLASNTAFNAIVNGSYSEIDVGEIFEATRKDNYQIRIKLPKPVDPLLIGSSSRIPDGYLVTDDSADEHNAYSRRVIERYDNKKKGETMRICAGQTMPDGFGEIDRASDPSVCPGEQPDVKGFTYKVILRTTEPKELPKAAQDAVLIGRSRDTPPGFLITNYFSDPMKYPNPSGDAKSYSYNGKVIESYAMKKDGQTMTMCLEDQTIPDGFREIDAPNDPSVCPREPGDPRSGPTYRVILRMRGNPPKN